MSGQKTEITIQDAMRGAFAALLKGDTRTRDTLCDVMAAEFASEGAVSLPNEHPIKDENLAIGLRKKIPPVDSN